MGDPRTDHAVSTAGTEEFRTDGSPALLAEISNDCLDYVHAYSGFVRTACCGNLRGATPKHKPDCHRAAENCPGCLDRAMVHIASCRFSAEEAVGIDTPAVGNVRGSEPPVLTRPDWMLGSDDFGGDSEGLVGALAPLAALGTHGAPLTAFGAVEREWTPSELIEAYCPDLLGQPRPLSRASEGALSELFFMARNLAQSRIITTLEPRHPDARWLCVECGMIEPQKNSAIPHPAACIVGQVLRLIDVILELDSLPAEVNHAANAGGGEYSFDDYGLSAADGVGEPWRYREYPELDTICLYDCNGLLRVRTDGCDSAALETAERIVDCVNSCAPGVAVPTYAATLSADRECDKCGERGGLWSLHETDAAAMLRNLGLNQQIGPTATGLGHILYTHLCGPRLDGAVAK